MSLDRPQPIAAQINAILRDRIRNKTYAPASRLPSEAELSRELGVSRATLRTALAKLATEGLIIRKQGDGTFVNAHMSEVNTSLGGMLDFWRLIESSGAAPSIQTISIAPRGATEAEAASLQIAVDAPVSSLVRLFLADDTPFILAMNVIPATLFVTDDDLYDGRLPLPDFLRRYCECELSYAIYNINAALVDDKVAQFLRRPTQSPILQLTTTFYNASNEPLVYGKSFYDDALLNLSFVQSWDA